MDFKVSGLPAEPFRRFYGMSDQDLAREGVQRLVADEMDGFPDRIEMRDVDIGERVLLLNHVCQPAETPYRASHAIFVKEWAETSYEGVNVIPAVMRSRLLSLRAYDAVGMMLDGDVVEGNAVERVITRFFTSTQIAYIHAHNAKRGCYSGRIDRLGQGRR